MSAFSGSRRHARFGFRHLNPRFSPTAIFSSTLTRAAAPTLPVSETVSTPAVGETLSPEESTSAVIERPSSSIPVPVESTPMASVAARPQQTASETPNLVTTATPPQTSTPQLATTASVTTLLPGTSAAFSSGSLSQTTLNAVASSSETAASSSGTNGALVGGVVSAVVVGGALLIAAAVIIMKRRKRGSTRQLDPYEFSNSAVGSDAPASRGLPPAMMEYSATNRPPTFGTLYGLGAPAPQNTVAQNSISPAATYAAAYTTPAYTAPAYPASQPYSNAAYGQPTQTTAPSSPSDVSRSYEDGSFWSDTQSHYEAPANGNEPRLSNAGARRSVPMPVVEDGSPYSPMQRQSVTPLLADNYSVFRPESEAHVVDSFPSPPTAIVANVSRYQASAPSTPIVQSPSIRYPSGGTESPLPNSFIVEGMRVPDGDFPATPTSTWVSHIASPQATPATGTSVELLSIVKNAEQTEQARSPFGIESGSLRNPFEHPEERRLSAATFPSSVNTQQAPTIPSTPPPAISQLSETPMSPGSVTSAKAPTIDITFPETGFSFMNMADTPAPDRQSFVTAASTIASSTAVPPVPSVPASNSAQGIHVSKDSVSNTDTAMARKSVYGDEEDAYGGI